MKLKICGITNKEDLELSALYGDALGFILEYPDSPRSITIEHARELMKDVPPFVTSVVVIPDFSKAQEIHDQLRPEVIQLHGRETPEDVSTFREKVQCKIIKACGTELASEFSQYADALLIDDKYSEFDLDEVKELIQSLDVPIILAGGLNYDNILDVLGKVQPYAIDVASGVESQPGKKDPVKIKTFRKRVDLGGTVGKIMASKPRAAGNRFYRALSEGTRPKLITEVKPASPSKGELKDVSLDLEGIIRAMEAGGADALSVLVEEQRFGGSIDLLRRVRSLTNLPILAKGFISELEEIAEVAEAGADAFLLMVRVAEAKGKSVGELLEAGRSAELDAVVEVATAEELNSALEAGARIVEVNNRDIYGDLQIDLGNVALGRTLPAGILYITASGMENGGHIMKLYEMSGRRANVFLVGTSIMKSRDIQGKVRELANACREVAG